jgi:hypothetical protein
MLWHYPAWLSSMDSFGEITMWPIKRYVENLKPEVWFAFLWYPETHSDLCLIVFSNMSIHPKDIPWTSKKYDKQYVTPPIWVLWTKFASILRWYEEDTVDGGDEVEECTLNGGPVQTPVQKPRKTMIVRMLNLEYQTDHNPRETLRD